MATSPGNAQGQILEVQAGKLRCCLDLDSVVRATNLVELQPIPNAPPFIKGAFDYAGATLLAIDLAERLGMSDHRPYTLNTPMLICRGDRMMGALIVDEVLGLARLLDMQCSHGEIFDRPLVAPFKGLQITAHGPTLQLDVDAALDVQISSGFFDPPAESDDDAVPATAVEDLS
jgi:chemotaxis signal transduction protein